MNKKYPTVFHLVSDIFNKAGIPYILIGGFAINYYKVSRQTLDVDFMIAETDYAKILKLFEEVGYKEDYRQIAFARLKGEEIYLMDIDLMFVDNNTFSQVLSDAKNIQIAGQKFAIPSIKHLLMLKLHALKNNYKMRELKDLPDIVNLIRANKLNIKEEEFKDIFMKYGTKEIYTKILDLL